MNESLLTKEELAVRINLTVAQIDRLRKEQKIHPVEGFKRPFKYNLKTVMEDIEKLGNTKKGA
jgi:hypothetical protein